MQGNQGVSETEVSEPSIKLLEINCKVSKLEQREKEALTCPGQITEKVDTMRDNCEENDLKA